MKGEEKELGNCTLIEVRKPDYAQCYQFEDGRIEWLLGWNRATNVKVSDKGRMVYRTSPGGSWGLPFFIKEG